MDQRIDELAAEESMFVQTAQGITSNGRPSPCTGSRPRRSPSPTGPGGSSGTWRPAISSPWGGEGGNSFESDPPNAGVPRARRWPARGRGDRDHEPTPRRPGSPIRRRRTRGKGSRKGWARHPVHRSVRAAVVARGVR